MNPDDQQLGELREYYRVNFADGESDAQFLAWVERWVERKRSRSRVADILIACHDVMRDVLAQRQGRPSEFVSEQRLEQLASAAREAARKCE